MLIMSCVKPASMIYKIVIIIQKVHNEATAM